MQRSEKPKYAYIDCVRGYAVLAVITDHLAYEFPELPYPAHRLAVLGGHGVQLFFLASCVTLLMSWNYEKTERGAADARAFFIRRFLRIAPAYYAAAALYYWVTPPLGGFDGLQLAAFLSFTNAWHPSLTPTVADRWVVVPGGWSISVEFAFYFLFPLIATCVTSLGRGILFVAFAMAAGLVCNLIGWAGWVSAIAATSLDNFLYFWFPNQAVVFALGTVLYYLIQWLAMPGAAAVRATLAAYHNLIPFLAFAALVALAYTTLAHRIGLTPPYIPADLAVCAPFMVLILCLSTTTNGIFVNPAIAAMGRVSFSGYLLHFVVLKLLPNQFPSLFGVNTTGYAAIGAYIATWIVVVPVTFVVSWCTYRLIEHPMMSLAKVLTRPTAEASASGKRDSSERPAGA